MMRCSFCVFLIFLKFVYSEKAKKICEIFNVDLSGTTHSSLVDYLAQVIYAKKLSHHFLLHFPIGMGSYDHHAKNQGVFT